MTPLSAFEEVLFRSTASAGGRALLILIYHRVVAEPDELLRNTPDAKLFGEHLDLLSSVFRPLPLSEALQHLQGGTLPRRALCVTFDDGYANNHDVALPILKAHGVPATVFVTTSYLDGSTMWNDRVLESVRRAPARIDLGTMGLGTFEMPDASSRYRTITQITRALKHQEPTQRLRSVEQLVATVGADAPRDLMMTRSQVHALHDAGIEIGAHTITHPILAKLGDAEARQEIAGSKTELESVVGAPVTLFAYPNGRPHDDYDARHVKMVRDAGFRAALSTAWGCARADVDLFQVPRVAPWDREAWRFAARLLKTYLPARVQVA